MSAFRNALLFGRMALHLKNTVYRAMNPRWAREPLSGEGASKYGGRFNPKGLSALYCALSPVTALRETNQVGSHQPTTLVAYHADIDTIFDGRDDAALAEFAMTKKMLSDISWRERMYAGVEVPTHNFARALVGQNYNGLLVPSFARGATEDDISLVLWKWSDKLPCKLEVIDDENRLSLGLT